MDEMQSRWAAMARETQRRLEGGKTWVCKECEKKVWTIDPDKMPFDWCYADEWYSPFECEETDVLCDECNSMYAMEE